MNRRLYNNQIYRVFAISNFYQKTLTKAILESDAWGFALP